MPRHGLFRQLPGLSIRDCTVSPNNLIPVSFKPSAIDVTQKAIFERFVLSPRPRQFVPFVTMPYAPTPTPLCCLLFLDFGVAPKFCVCNLAESRSCEVKFNACNGSGSVIVMI